MKQVLSLFTFGIAALFFLAFFATLKPTVVSAASGPGKPGQCSTKAPPSLGPGPRWSLLPRDIRPQCCGKYQ
jgi:hypothetical protein